MTAQPDEGTRGRLKAALAIAQAIILAAAIAYIAWTLAGHWQSLRRHTWTLRPGPFLISIPLAAAWFLGRAWLWQRILVAFGHPLAYRRCFRTFILAELSRYLPGTVWHVFGRSYYANRQGVPTAVTLTGLILEMALVALTAVAFFPLRAIGGGRLLEGLAVWAAAAVFLLLVVAHPRVIVPLVNLGLRRLRKPLISATLRYRDILTMLGLCIAMWACMCAAFWLLAVSVVPAARNAAVGVAASFPAAWFVGLVAIAAPGGLGAREGALAALLGGLLPSGMGVVVALVSRLWLTGIELICALVAWRLQE
jgi:hypothetical protein